MMGCLSAANSGSRGLRELKGLISYVNYDDVSSRSRSRASSTVVEVVGSFKWLYDYFLGM